MLIRVSLEVFTAKLKYVAPSLRLVMKYRPADFPYGIAAPRVTEIIDTAFSVQPSQGTGCKILVASHNKPAIIKGADSLGRCCLVLLQEENRQFQAWFVAGCMVKGLEHQMAEEETQVERGIAEMPRFEIDHHQTTGVDQQILGTEIGMYQTKYFGSQSRDDAFDGRLKVLMSSRDFPVVRIDSQAIEQVLISELALQRFVAPRSRVQDAQQVATCGRDRRVESAL
jgi:hypothetical protein